MEIPFQSPWSQLLGCLSSDLRIKCGWKIPIANTNWYQEQEVVVSYMQWKPSAFATVKLHFRFPEARKTLSLMLSRFPGFGAPLHE